MVPYKRYGKINDPPDVCFAPFLRYKFYTFTIMRRSILQVLDWPC